MIPRWFAYFAVLMVAAAMALAAAGDLLDDRSADCNPPEPETSEPADEGIECPKEEGSE